MDCLEKFQFPLKMVKIGMTIKWLSELTCIMLTKYLNLQVECLLYTNSGVDQ